MPLSVKKKIWLGTSFLFTLLIITGVVSIYQIVKLKNESRAILQDNYETLSYCHAMQQELDVMEKDSIRSLHLVDSNLQLQESNVTEPGEGALTSSLRVGFNKLKRGDTSQLRLISLKQTLQAIIALNMQAIQRKNDKAERTAETTLTVIEVLLSVVFLLSFTFLLNFPSIIAKPIRNLYEAIGEISNKNYQHRIRTNRKDEFGKVAEAFNQMAERLAFFENSNLNKLMFEKSRAEAVINSLKDATIGIDQSNKVLFANIQALELLGISSSEVVGRNVDEISRKNDLFAFLLQSDAKAPFKIVVEGRENYFTREVIEVDQGEAGSRLIVLRNITSFKELDVAKTNFIATISHELKTPLAASDFSLRLLEDERLGQLSAEQKELIAHLKQDNQRILKILSELLNMSQVEAGRIQLNIEDVDPLVLIDNAILTVASGAREMDIAIRKNIQENLPHISADAEKTTWVINNLLTNAIKYSTAGSHIDIVASVSNNMLTISVSDSGPGISKEYQTRIFERYFQVPGAKAKGTGLGLAISREFIQAQHGRIWVDSDLGKGATFSFSLPV